MDVLDRLHRVDAVGREPHGVDATRAAGGRSCTASTPRAAGGREVSAGGVRQVSARGVRLEALRLAARCSGTAVHDARREVA